MTTQWTDTAEQAIRRSVRYARSQADLPEPFLAGIAVAGYVAGRLSPSLYGDMIAAGDPLPPASWNDRIAEVALAYGAGLCGQAAATARVLYERLGIRSRQLDLLSEAGGHTTVEIAYLGGWHWFDPTHAYHYRAWTGEPWDVLSVADWLLGQPAVRVDGSLSACVARLTGAEHGSGLALDRSRIVRVADHDRADA